VDIRFRKIILAIDIVQDESFFDGMMEYTNETYNYANFQLQLFGTFLGSPSGVSGSGRVAYLNFTTIYNGTVNMEIVDSLMYDSEENEIGHTSAGCSVTVTGTSNQTFLQVDPISNGVLNITEGIHIYDNTSITTIYANQTIAVFQYFTLDDIQNNSNPISIPMTSDHEVSVTFTIPTFTISTQPSVTVKINSSPYQTNSQGNLSLHLSVGIYQVELSKAWYYTYESSVNLTEDITINVSLNQTLYTESIPHTSEQSIMQATIPYNNESTNGYYVDGDKLMYAEPVFNKTGKIGIVFHYGTNYPIVEINSENISKICFDLTNVYLKYYMASYSNMIGMSQFTGIKIDSNVPLRLELGMPQPSDLWKKPIKIYKMNPGSGIIEEFTSWYYSDFVVYLDFEPGDPTLSLIFPAPNNITLTMFNLLPFIFIVGSVVFLAGAILEARHKSMKEFVLLIVLALFMVLLIPIVPVIVGGI
jgi:hypothetical protein